jgi:hypothetical protein
VLLGTDGCFAMPSASHSPVGRWFSCTRVVLMYRRGTIRAHPIPPSPCAGQPLGGEGSWLASPSGKHGSGVFLAAAFALLCKARLVCMGARVAHGKSAHRVPGGVCWER